MKFDFLKSILILCGASIFWSCSAGRGARQDSGSRRDFATRQDYNARPDYGAGHDYNFRQEDGGKLERDSYRDNRGPYVSFGAPRSDASGTPEPPEFESKLGGESKRGKYGFFDFLNYWDATPPDNTDDNGEADDFACPEPCINYRVNLKEIRKLKDQIKYLYGAMNDRNKDTLQDQIGELEYEVRDLNDDNKSVLLEAENCGCIK